MKNSRAFLLTLTSAVLSLPAFADENVRKPEEILAEGYTPVQYAGQRMAGEPLNPTLRIPWTGPWPS